MGRGGRARGEPAAEERRERGRAAGAREPASPAAPRHGARHDAKTRAAADARAPRVAAARPSGRAARARIATRTVFPSSRTRPNTRDARGKVNGRARRGRRRHHPDDARAAAMSVDARCMGRWLNKTQPSKIGYNSRRMIQQSSVPSVVSRHDGVHPVYDDSFPHLRDPPRVSSLLPHRLHRRVRVPRRPLRRRSSRRARRPATPFQTQSS